MWSEALSMIDRAERLHRHFFTHAQAAWEPPIDIVEAGDRVLVHVALPGVASDDITIGIDRAGISLSAVRPFPCRGGSEDAPAHIHRIEIPYGRFERHIRLPLGELVEQQLKDGVLTLTFLPKEGE